MIKQIAIPLQILSGAEELLGACHAVAGSVNYQCAGDGSAMPPPVTHKKTEAKKKKRKADLKNYQKEMRRVSMSSVCTYVSTILVVKLCECMDGCQLMGL